RNGQCAAGRDPRKRRGCRRRGAQARARCWLDLHRWQMALPVVQAKAGSRRMNWIRRLSAWLWSIDMRAAEAEAHRIRREVTIYDLAANVDELTRAIDLVAGAMPNGGGVFF